MIVCKRCGNHNAADDEFCGSCGVFLEWEGERIVDAADEADAPAPLPPPSGLVSKIKHAVLGDAAELPPPTSAGTGPTAVAPQPGSPLKAPMPNPDPTSVASALVAKPPPPPVSPAARQPAPQTPTAAVARPKPQIKQPPTRTINAGDLVCGTCGEVNGAERHFCRRCGTTLAEVVPVKRHWWQRKRSADSMASPVSAGSETTTPGQRSASTAAGGMQSGAGGAATGAGKAKSARKGARKVKGGVFGGFSRVRRVIAVLAILGIGTGLAVPSLRSTITNKAGDIFNSVKRKINPSYTQVGPDDTLTTATSAVAGHEGGMVADGGSNTYWLATPDDATATVTVVFKPPTSLAKILITSGDQEKPTDFKAQPRPKDVFVTALDAAGKVLKTKQIALEDKAAPQEVAFSASGVVSFALTVQSCYPDPALKVCAVTEIEFFKLK